ncbi:HNH endonuclease [Weissella sp. GP1]|uniref:HNH endonuclease n=1 Tax=Weissella confusa TaxID=1583 RepID=UPI0032D9C311
MNKQTFKSWLSKLDLNPKTVVIYANRVDEFTKAEKTDQFGIEPFDIYNPINRNKILQVMRSPKFKEINDVKKQYSSALNRFIQYQDIVHLENDGDFLNLGIEGKMPPLSHLDVPRTIPEKMFVSKESFSRSRLLSLQALADSNYTCEFNSDHKSFKSRYTNMMYVEAHHLIPLSFQNKFNFCLDVPANIVSLCPNCHRSIHFAYLSIIESILKKLLNDRKDRLLKSQISVTYDKLLNFYI